jgi:diguanylate cyclase (GGDEF)-like protein
MRDLGAASAMAAPILFEGRVWGEFFITRPPTAEAFDAEDLAFIAAFAGLISAGLAQIEHLGRVEKMAYQDPLTGLGNRHRIEEQLDLAVARFLHEQAPVTVVMADVNKLKQANDDFGHDAGDRALVAVANALSIATGAVPGAVAGRMGGDEFCAVLPGYALEVGEALAAAFLRGTSSAPHGVSVACGVASTDLMHGPVTPGLLLAMADGAQYEAKRAGARHPVTADPDFSFEARRERRDRSDPPGLLPTVLGALSATAGGAVQDRLAAAAATLAEAIGASGWVVSRLRSGAAVPAVHGSTKGATAGTMAGVSVPAPERAAWMTAARSQGAVVDGLDEDVPLAAVRGCTRVVVAVAGEWMVELLCQAVPPADAPGVLRAAVGVALAP